MRALDGGRDSGLRVVYQQQVDRNGVVVSAEALLRCRHVDGTVIPAPVVVEEAEASGQSRDLLAFVLAETCVTVAATAGRVPIAVNASGHLFGTGQVVETVSAALAATGVAATAVTVEMTETTTPACAADAVLELAALRALGCRTAIDDFGSGHATSDRLRWPVDAVKLDREFVALMATDPDQVAVVSAVVADVHAQDGIVVAEGIETPAQFALCAAVDVDVFQGWLFGLPAEHADFVAARMP